MSPPRLLQGAKRANLCLCALFRPATRTNPRAKTLQIQRDPQPQTLWTRPGHSKKLHPICPPTADNPPLSGNDEDPYSGPDATIPPTPAAGRSLFALDYSPSTRMSLHRVHRPHELCPAANDRPVAGVAWAWDVPPSHDTPTSPPPQVPSAGLLGVWDT
eukprot:CAMPEP_0198295374 /NCGR_PEP_ID=MMETSP1449-20131203/27355_1 /TAXON_ID=420275 /ORGANISM="Attheya septentrionalis, Strain CCMP2084" /LENGTH=158 /DNA_ID=CAMNT_0043995659 /DNA_START=118 /DNA_END=592 /DNA_ORIENTATION=+